MRLIMLGLAALLFTGCESTGLVYDDTVSRAAGAPSGVAVPAVLPNGQVGVRATCQQDVAICYSKARTECGGDILVIDQQVQQFAGADPGLPPTRPLDLSNALCTDNSVQCSFERGRAAGNNAAYARRQREYEARVEASGPRTEYVVLSQCAANTGARAPKKP